MTRNSHSMRAMLQTMRAAHRRRSEEWTQRIEVAPEHGPRRPL
jgi:hypothetical protein